MKRSHVRHSSAFAIANFAFLFAICFASAQQNNKDLKVEADTYDFDMKSGWATGSGDVILNYSDMTLQSDTFRYNTSSKEVEAQGAVTFFNPATDKNASFKWETEQVSGNIETGAYQSSEHRVTFGNIFERGEAAERTEGGVLVFDGAQLSTCEYLVDDDGSHAHYHIRAKEITYNPETGQFRAEHAVFKVGNIPIFYWPVVYYDRDWKPGNTTVKVGHDSDWGAFILLGQQWQITENLDTFWNLDYRSRRGIAFGNTTTYTTPNTETEFYGYILPGDDNPPETTPGLNRRFDVEDDRYRIRFYHLNRLTENWTFRLNINALSDIDMLEEWYEDEFDVNPQPYTYADLTYDHERFTFSILAQPRINDFYTVVERLPEIRIDLPRQPLGDSGLYYQGETSFAHLEMKWRDFDVDRAAGVTDEPEDYDSWRFDSLHMLYYPLNAGKFQFTPRAGARFTWYSETSDRDITTNDLVTLYEVDDPYTETIADPITNYDDDGGSAFRVAGELGLEISRKYRTVWEDGNLPFMENDGLRLITKPYVNYTYITDPSEDRENLYFFDRIDRITEQNFVRVGVENRLQTRNRRRSGIYTLARMNTYADFHFDPLDDQNFGTFANDLEFTPSSKFSLYGLVQLDMDSGNLNHLSGGFTIGETGATQLTVSYVYTDEYLSDEINSFGTTLVDYTGENLSTIEFFRNNIGYAKLTVPFTDKTTGSVTYAYDFEDSETAYAIYQITQDLHCWMGALRYTTEESGDEETSEIMVMLWLKAFPSVGVGLGQ